MGLYAHRFYFEFGLPKVKPILEKFHEITGLTAQFYSIVHLEELMTDDDDILHYFNRRRQESRSVGINTPYFACKGFDHVYLEDYVDISQKTFYLEFGGGKVNKYFYRAMIKTMLEIGGQTYKNHVVWEEETDEFIQQHLEPYHPHEPYWKQVKPWDSMSEFEKNRFI